MEMNPNETPVVVAEAPVAPAKKGPWKLLAIVFMAVAIVAIIGCVVLAATSVASNSKSRGKIADLESEKIVLMNDNADLSDEVASLTKKVDDLNDEIEEKDEEISKKNKQISSLSVDSKTLDDMVTFLKRSDAGKADYKFKTDTPIVVMKRGDPKRTITLTADYRTSYGFKFSNSNVCYLEFANNSWYGAFVDLELTPKNTGVTYVTFYNELNSKTFQVMVVVTD